jgi:eukaryotic-like serine/threonine-protein kinase
MEQGAVIADRYRVGREIGRGSFGIVYHADDLQSGEPRAIKVLLPWAARNEQLRHRLRREARLAGSLTGEHAVRIFESGETADGDVFLAMELLQGQELNQVLRESGPLPPARVQRIAEQVLAALSEAHALGVIHRDLKPHNIFLCTTVDGGDHVKVFDFGIAKVTGDGNLMATAKLTISGGVMGTPVYMSPEQCRGAELTPAADFYSLGIVLYELLTGRVPFDDENPVQVLLKHNHEPPPPLPQPLAASSLGKAIMRALAKDPGARFASAEEFHSALQGMDVPLPTQSQPSAIPASSAASRQSDASDMVGIDSAPRSALMQWLGWAVLALVLIAVAIAVFALRS